MKIIGNREALELARKKFGERAAIQKITKERGKNFGGQYLVGTVVVLAGFPMFKVKGKGKSWDEALRAAGVEIPNETNCANVPTPADIEKLAGGGE